LNRWRPGSKDGHLSGARLRKSFGLVKPDIHFFVAARESVRLDSLYSENPRDG
jgi:hypothetical protein